MDINFLDIYNGISLGGSLAGSLLKFLIAILLFGILFYSFMFIIKLRVLQDTIDISNSSMIKKIITINLIIALIGSILSFILILL
jgi:hypothetical protein